MAGPAGVFFQKGASLDVDSVFFGLFHIRGQQIGCDFNGQMFEQLAHLGINGRSVEKFGENEQSHVAKGPVAHDSLFNECLSMADTLGQFCPGGGVR